MPRRHFSFTASIAAPALLSVVAASAQEQAQPVQAIWKDQEITFYFQSFTTFYSCSSLENKVERLLEELGADAKVRVRAVECPGGIASMPRVVVQVRSPVEATPEALAERDKDKGTRELAARVKGKQAEQALQESLEQFPAQWRSVSLSRGKLDIEPGDCELIHELNRKVLPKLAVRVLEDNVQCAPRQLTLGQPQLEVQALVEVPKPDAAGNAKQKRKRKKDDVEFVVNPAPR